MSRIFNQPFNYFLSKIGCRSTHASALAPRPPLPQTTPPVSCPTWSTCPTLAPTCVRNPAPRLAEPQAALAASSGAGRGRSTVTPSGCTASPRDVPGLAMWTSVPVVPPSAPPPRHTGSPTPPSLTPPRPPLTLTPETGVHPPLTVTDPHPLLLPPTPSSHSAGLRRLCTSFWSARSACNSGPYQAGATRKYVPPWRNCRRRVWNPMGFLPVSFPARLVKYQLKATGA